MIQRAIKLRNEVDLFVCRHQQPAKKKRDGTAEEVSLKQDTLTPEDWSVLTELLSLLKPFQTLTVRMEGSASKGERGALFEVMPSIMILLEHLEQKRDSYVTLSDSEYYSQEAWKHLATASNNAWAKLRKYYTLCDNSTAYVASLVMNPRCKWKMLETRWLNNPEWIESARKEVDILWRECYKNQVEPVSPTNSEAKVAEPDIFDNSIAVDTPSRYETDQYQHYCDRSTEQVNDLVDRWRVQETQTPQLTQMALDLLSIPAMSAKCERVFSSAKQLLTDRRNRLKTDVIEANECLRAWITQGF